MSNIAGFADRGHRHQQDLAALRAHQEHLEADLPQLRAALAPADRRARRALTDAAGVGDRPAVHGILLLAIIPVTSFPQSLSGNPLILLDTRSPLKACGDKLRGYGGLCTLTFARQYCT